MEAISYITSNWDSVLIAIGAMIGGASALVRILVPLAKMTKTTKDDAILQSILNFLQAIALNTKKEDARK